MRGFLKVTPVTDEQRRANDRHSGRAVAAVLLVLLAYLYLFTNASTLVGIPAPGDIAQSIGTYDEMVFDEGGIVDSSLGFAFVLRGDEGVLLIFFALTMLTFLAGYFLPLRFKPSALLMGAVAILTLVYGPHAVAALLFAHTLVYLVFHPSRRSFFYPWLGVLGALVFPAADAGLATRLAWMVGLTLLAAVAYRFVLLPLLGRPRVAPWLRGVAAHVALVLIVAFALFEGRTHSEIALGLGFLLFFWNWARLIMYQVDFNDGAVPKDTSLARYLAVFLSPGALANWEWGPEIGLGYAYTNNAFLDKDKNRIVMSGVRLLWLAMGYLVLADWARNLLLDGLSMLGLEVHGGYIIHMVDHFMAGGEVSPATVLATSFLDTLRWTLRFIGVVHFKVGIWRICGYDLATYFDRPWLSTNLVTFWARYTYYYREFLLRAFYYPVFLHFFKKRPRLRMVVATVAAAGVGNLIWGHVTAYMFHRGATFGELLNILHTWPYYLFLSVGTALTALYLLEFAKKKKRRPWTRSPWIATDVLASFCTMQYFALIHVMSRPSSGSNEWDLFQLFMRAFGVHL